MDEKSLRILELDRVLLRLAHHASFSAGQEACREIRPAADIAIANRLLQETSEARVLFLRHADLTLGGAHDIRPYAEDAVRGITLLPERILDIRSTLQSARSLKRSLTRLPEENPRLSELAATMPDCPGLIEMIGRILNDDGVVRDDASEKLAALRVEARSTLDRLLSRLNRVLSEHATHLQEAIITQRDGRYVVPLRAEFKGRLRGIVHDQSASGATLFVEPLVTVEAGNRWREAVLEEQQEVQRILAELSRVIGENREQILQIVASLANLDVAFARAHYADELNAECPELLALPERPQEDFSPLTLYGARHPLLDSEKVVPTDIALRPGIKALVITGPNTGGKTVALKTGGLLVLMAQCGLHIPAGPGSKVSFFDSVFADIGDEQSIEQSLSTFSAHIAQISRILQNATSRSLVILDELGSGTDPQEGSALARALLAEFLRRGIHTMIATHFPELKVFAHNTDGVENASMEFDLRSLRPTYRLILGLPGRSNALAIAKRLGLDEAILDEALTMLDSRELESGKLLERIQRDRGAARREREDAEKLNRRSREHERQLAHRLEQIEKERDAILAEAREQARNETDSLLEELRSLRRKASDAVGAELSALQVKAREAEERIVQATEPSLKEASITLPPRPPKVGEKVKLKSLPIPGTVLAVEKDTFDVQVGALRIRASLEDFAFANASTEEPVASKREPSPGIKVQAKSAAGMEIDLRGQMVEDALIDLERHLDSASLAGLPWVRIIHGKGSGRLRAAIRESLKKNPLVGRVETGGEVEGGEGVSIVHFA